MTNVGLYSEAVIQEKLGIALQVVKERLDVLSKTAPSHLWDTVHSNCTEVISTMETLFGGRMDLSKLFLADLAVTATRVWEAFSVSEAGRIF